jgi:hypothetical protein
VISQEYEAPKITKLGGEYKQSYGRPIEYTFLDTVSSLIAGYIKRDSLVDYFIEMDFKDNLYYLKVREGGLDGDTLSRYSCLLSSTNRFCKIGNKTLPIYFSHDMEFGFYGFFFTGTSIWIIIRRLAYLEYELVDVYLTH